MKVILLFVLIALAAANLSLGTKWSLWKKVHTKAYSSDEEEVVRFNAFAANVKEIKRLNELHKNATAHFGLNKFADRTPAEMKRLRLTRVPADVREGMAVAAPLDVSATANTVDWRQQNVVSPVQNQGMCGSCWAFSATANIESRWALARKQTPPLKLAEQALVDCDHECGNYRGEEGCDAGCNGGLMPNAFKYVMKHGQPLETSYPYQGVDGSCKGYLHSPVNISSWEFVPQDEAQIAAYVQKNGPVSVAVYAEEWSFYMGGIMSYLCPGKTKMEDLDHGVAIVGFGTDGSTPYWIIRNSWGPDWGESGYARIYRGSNFCGVALMACSAIV